LGSQHKTNYRAVSNDRHRSIGLSSKKGFLPALKETTNGQNMPFWQGYHGDIVQGSRMKGPIETGLMKNKKAKGVYKVRL
jgi:hypothetical protein